MALKILLLEDEIELLDSLKNFFESFDHYKVFATPRGDEALTIIERERPDVILCDLQLEHSPITGIEVLKQTHRKYPDIKVIVTTGYGKDDDIVRVCSQYNPHMFIAKPINLIKLHETLVGLPADLK